MMACELEGVVAGSVVVLQLSGARMQESFHDKWTQQRVVGLSHLGGGPFLLKR